MGEESECGVDGVREVKGEIDDEVVGWISEVERGVGKESEGRSSGERGLRGEVGDREGGVNEKVE